MQAHFRSNMKPFAWWNVLLIAPFVATLLPGLYNFAEPQLFGMPFFYWWQLAWTIISGLMLALYIAVKRGGSSNAG
jgi:hypothetical protein